MRRTTVPPVASIAVSLAAAFAMVLFPGCSREAPAPAPVVKKLAPKPEAKAPPVPAPGAQAAPPAAVALYETRGKRDPFLPFVKAEQGKRSGKAADDLPPLQRYEVGELKFVGVIWTKNGARALVEDAEGKGYSVTVGTRIGRSGGVVSRITDREIRVREEFVGNRGQKVVRESGIELTTAGGK